MQLETHHSTRGLRGQATRLHATLLLFNKWLSRCIVVTRHKAKVVKKNSEIPRSQKLTEPSTTESFVSLNSGLLAWGRSKACIRRREVWREVEIGRVGRNCVTPPRAAVPVGQRSALREDEHKENKDRTDAGASVECRRKDVIVTAPAGKMLPLPVHVGQETDCEPARVINRCRRRNETSTGEDDGPIDKAQP